jgi:hypothetical protein
MQHRFERFTKRVMTERDYSAWIAVRAIGEAVTMSRFRWSAPARRVAARLNW